MTATQHSPVATTDSLPLAIRRLEAARPGDLAIHPDSGASALKMRGGGRPWLLDPWGHASGPERVTTAALAGVGYRTDAEESERELSIYPTIEATVAHIESLRQDGWADPVIAEAAGVTRKTVTALRGGTEMSERTMTKVLLVHVDDFAHHAPARGAERLEDLAWLLEVNVGPEQAVARCGFPNVEAARASAGRGGRKDLLPKLHLPVAAPEDEEAYEDDGPSPHDFVLAAVVEMEEATISDLTIATGLTKQGVRYHLDALLRQGRVGRESAGEGRTATYFPATKEIA